MSGRNLRRKPGNLLVLGYHRRQSCLISTTHLVDLRTIFIAHESWHGLDSAHCRDLFVGIHIYFDEFTFRVLLGKLLKDRCNDCIQVSKE